MSPTSEHVTIRLVFGAQSIPVTRKSCLFNVLRNVQSLACLSYW